jgi:hypothetical protein
MHRNVSLFAYFDLSDQNRRSGFKEEIMPSQSIQELEARLQLTLRSLEEPEADTGNSEIGGHEDDLSRRLQLARLGLVQALRDCIAFKIGEADRRVTARLKKELHEAEIEFSASERKLRLLEGGTGTFPQLWAARDAARGRWESALRKLARHRSAGSKLVESYPI